MAVPRYLPQDRLQDLQPLQGLWLEGLTDRSRRPYRQANKLPFQVEKLIVQLKQERPRWDAPKTREKLRRLNSDAQPMSPVSTVTYVTGIHPLRYPAHS